MTVSAAICPRLDAHIEAQDAPEHGNRVITQRQLLQTRREAKAVQQTEAEYRPKQVR